MRVSSSKIATTQLHACHVAFARLVSRAPTDGDFDSHYMYMPRHARGANSGPRSRPHAVPERLDDRVWAMPSSSSPKYSGAIHARIVRVLLSCVIHGNTRTASRKYPPPPDEIASFNFSLKRALQDETLVP